MHIIIIIVMLYFYRSSDETDYVRVSSRELTFLSGQSSTNMSTSCTELEILDDIALEDQETFSVVLTSRLTEVIITSGREQAQVLINEDSLDGMLKIMCWRKLRESSESHTFTDCCV